MIAGILITTNTATVRSCRIFYAGKRQTTNSYLTPPRRVVTFDFLGWGGSDKPLDYPYTVKNQEGDLDAVIKQQKLEQGIKDSCRARGSMSTCRSQPAEGKTKLPPTEHPATIR